MTRPQNLLNTFPERENTMRACDFHIAASALPAFEAEQVCFAAFSKTKAKTTTKTV